jgi:2'-5' RNA ligase
MRNFFETVASWWGPGQLHYHWHILPPPAATMAIVEQCRELTDHAGLAAVAPHWVHITLLHAAHVDEVPDAQLGQIVERARERCARIPGFTLTLDRPQASSLAIECLGRPGEPARQLWRLLAGITRDVTGSRFETVPSVYYPHASLAYAITDDLDNRILGAWLSDCAAEPITFPVTRISLVAQSHDLRYITWRHILDVDLAPASAGAASAGNQ